MSDYVIPVITPFYFYKTRYRFSKCIYSLNFYSALAGNTIETKLPNSTDRQTSLQHSKCWFIENNININNPETLCVFCETYDKPYHDIININFNKIVGKSGKINTKKKTLIVKRILPPGVTILSLHDLKTHWKIDLQMSSISVYVVPINHTAVLWVSCRLF